MSDGWTTALREHGLRVRLLLPFLLVGVVTAAFIVIAEIAITTMVDERAASHESQETLEAVQERLTSARFANESLARVVAADPELAVAVQIKDPKWIGEILAPIMDTSGLEQVGAYAWNKNESIYFRGSPDLDSDVESLVAAARAGSTGSALEAVDQGLRVSSASPIMGPSGQVGVLVAGRIVDDHALRGDVDGNDGVHLAFFHAGTLRSTTATDPALVDLLRRPGLVDDSVQHINSAISRLGRWGALSKLEDGSDIRLLVMVSTQHLQQASATLIVAMSLLILLLLVTLLLTGARVSKHVMQQLRATIHVAEGMAAGDYDQRVQPGDIKELNLLALTINNLGRQLQDHVARLSHQAFYDHLTGLANRALFMDRLGHALKSSARRDRMVAVLFLDLDNFKVVNDSLGHRAGDKLLVAAAQRLEDCLREGDTVARLGGDEFTVLIEDIVGEVAATSMAERIQERLKAPFVLEDREVFVTTSIGIAIAHHSKPEIDELLRNADLAMYRAKARGKACYEIFDRSLNERAIERLELEAEMRRAIDAGEFELHYQPIMSLDAESATGVEALLRWRHPTRGLLSPDQFISLAEETGLIIPIGRMVVREACQQVRRWQVQFPAWPPLSVSVNISGRQFQDAGLVETVARTLRETGLPPSCLILEITESVLMETMESIRSTLVRLKALGVQIAIDDFGTGYSSLAYLKHFPIDVLKIDRSFIKMIGQKPEDGAIVRTIVGLAKTLGLVVTGEGIETREQLTDLQAINCDEGQGYYFAKPAPADEMVAQLQSLCRTSNVVPIASKVANRS